MTIDALPLLCTQTEVERVLSANGVLAFADHDDDGVQDADVVEDAIQQASDEILMYLHDRYELTDLPNVALVRRWAAIGAACALCETRGNPIPESLATKWEKLIAQPDGVIPKMASGLLALPGVPLRYDSRPSFTNLRVDRRWPTSKVRVTRVNSSDAPTTLSQKYTVENAGFDQ